MNDKIKPLRSNWRPFNYIYNDGAFDFPPYRKQILDQAVRNSIPGIHSLNKPDEEAIERIAIGYADQIRKEFDKLSRKIKSL